MGNRWNATNLADDELFVRAASAWRARLWQLMEELGLSQTGLSDALNESLARGGCEEPPICYQRDVSAWANLGTHKRGSGERIRRTLFPRVEILLHLAEVLRTSVGYLIGETAEREPEGADGPAADEVRERILGAIRRLTGDDGDSGLVDVDRASLVLAMLESEAFPLLLSKMVRVMGRMRSASEGDGGRGVVEGRRGWLERQALHLAFDEVLDEILYGVDGDVGTSAA